MLGVVIIQKEDMKIDLFERIGDILIHKQFELRDGLFYMRMKKRKVIEV